MHASDFAVIDLERVALAAGIAKERRGVKVQVKRLGEGARGVGKEVDLDITTSEICETSLS